MPALAPPPLHVLLPWKVLSSTGPERLARLLAMVRNDRVVRLQFGPRRSWLVNDAEAARQVLQENAKAYKKSPNYELLKPFLGEGLFTSEGETWRRQRRLSQPAFHARALATMAEAMMDETSRMLERWEGFAKRGDTFDASAEMMRLTLSVVGRTLFSARLEDNASELGAALTTVLKLTERRMVSFVRVPEQVPTLSNVRYARALAHIDALVRRIIAERRAEKTERHDLLGMLMAARDEETGQGMSDGQLRDEVMTLVLAGHETTANALSFTWALLSQHPAVTRKLHGELAAVLGGRTPTVQDLKNLPYTTAVLQEVMRLYPPVWMIERQTLEPDTLLGHDIPAGTIVLVSPYLLHRHRDYWTNPEGFDPERFLVPTERPKFAYLPFGGGPRICIGNAFAMMEAQIVVALTASRFWVDVEPGYHLEPELMLVMRPKGGVRVRLRKRGAPNEPASAAA